MKKRVFSLFMALALCLSMLPAAAMAEDEGISTQAAGHEHCVCGAEHEKIGDHNDKETVTFDQVLNVDEDGDFTANGEKISDYYSNGLPAGNYYLEKSITIKKSIKVYSGTVNICLNGHSITLEDNGNYEQEVFYVATHGTRPAVLNLTDCGNIVGKVTHSNGCTGSGVTLGNSSSAKGEVFNLYGGEITGNTVAYGGAGVIKNNSSTYYGGGVSVAHESEFVMSGGEISENAAVYGGGVSTSLGALKGLDPSSFTMTGGTITKNTASQGGGVYHGGETFKVSGDATITENTANGKTDNVYLRTNDGKSATITIDGELTGEIGVSVPKKSDIPFTIATGADKDKNYTGIITSDDDTYEVAHDSTGGTKLVLVKNTPTPVGHQHPICGKNCGDGESHTSLSWTAIGTKDQLLNTSAGTENAKNYYYLTADIELNSTWRPNKYIVLDLNGHKIKGNGNFNVIEVGTSFTLTDCGGENNQTGQVTHGATYEGSGVYIEGTNANFTMYGGTITGNKANYGGGVNVDQYGKFEMSGGEISGNKANQDGGGVYVNYGTFTMDGGEISGNEATENGGGVHVAGGTFTMNDTASITDNTADQGGGVYVSYGDFIMSGGSITRNTGNGVCVHDKKAKFTVSGAPTIKENTRENAASNVWLGGYSTITIGGALTEGASIGVTKDSKLGNVIATGSTALTAEDAAKFKSDKGGYAVLVDTKNSNQLVLAKKTAATEEHKHDLCGTTHTPVGDHQTAQEVTFATELKQVNGQLTMGSQPWSAKSITINGSTPNCYVLPAGSYYLGSDLALDASIYISENVQLCLNGNSIISNGDNVGRDVVIVDTDSSDAFTLANCRNGGSITHATGKNGCGVYMNGNRTKFNMYGGIITGNNSGGVNVTQTNTFNMYGGSITNNSNGYGGGVYNGGTVNMYGGEISDNTASNKGGGVYMAASMGNYQGGILNVSGSAKITGNTVDGKANNVYLPSGKTITIGGKLTGGDKSIGVTSENTTIDTVIAEPATGVTLEDTDAAKFTSNNTNYSIILKDGKLVLTKKGDDPQPGKVDAGVKITADNANDPAPTKVVYGDTFNLGTTLKTTGTAGSPQSSKWTWGSYDSSVLEVTGSGSAATVKALKVGTATITVTYESENAKGTTTATITVNKRVISVKADNKDMTVGGELPAFTVTYGNFAFDDTADTVLETKTPSTAADGKTAGSFDITVEAPTIKSNYADKYTVGTPQKGTLTVNAAENPPQPSSGSSSRPSYSVSTPGKTENGSVSADVKNAKKGSTVTITVKPEDGFKLADLTVTDKDGNELALTDKGDGKYTFTMPAGKVEISAAFAEEIETSPFEDVAADAYYYEAVKWAAEQGIAEGTGKGLFGPEGTCTRGQIVTFLWRAAGSPVVNYAMDLADVDEDAYYAEAVRWALSEGVTSGTTDTTFAPDATCTRAQAMTFLFKAMKAAAEGMADFKDVADSDWFASAVAWAVENGVTAGVGGGLFGPDNDCTRGQIVTFLWKLYAGK